MAQTQSIYNNPLSGNLGNQTYKNYGGKQVITTRFRTTSAKGDGASRAQRDTRMLMPNLTLIGSQLGEWLPALWENNKFFKRPYTHFISHNMKRNLPVLPKEFIDLKRCVWGDLQVSCGTLTPIVYATGDDGYLRTDLIINTTGALSTKTLGSISTDIITHNPGWSNGDSLVFIQVRYQETSTLGTLYASYCTPTISALTLDVNSSKTLSASFKGPSIALVGAQSGTISNAICKQSAGNYQWAIVHVSKARGQYLASSQTMTSVFAGSEELESMFQQEYLDYCASTWGYKDKIL